MDNEYTQIDEYFVCNDCGAHSTSQETIIHFETCNCGESKRWEKVNNEFDWEEADRQDKEYERYLKSYELNSENYL
jgi:predicted RNA-binding Zn-ribbon protein involved in translation (DUF1610 family)